MEYLFPPTPGDTAMVFGAYLAGTGKLDLFALYVVTILGSISGFFILFFIGKYYGREFFLRRDYRLFPRKTILQTEKWFQHYGIALIAFNRFFSGARAVVSLIAGISNMKLSLTAMAAFFGCLIWNTLLLSGGYYMGKNWQTVITIITRYNQFVITVLILLLLLYFWKNRRKQSIK
jgi:membrane protein DedA with SNARE-associated domain